MASYLILNGIVLAVAAGVFMLYRRQLRLKPIIGAMVVLLVMTAVFDNLIILSGIVAYDVSKISGIYIGAAPIEDFAYSLAAMVLVPVIWLKLRARK